MPTHTPGPWTVEQWADDSPDHLRCFGLVMSPEAGDEYDKGGDVAYVCPCDHGEQEANARLIAAAPDLLAALEAIVNQREATPNPDVVEVGEASIQRARAAIRKARPSD
jgi:hypothetical protein